MTIASHVVRQRVNREAQDRSGRFMILCPFCWYSDAEEICPHCHGRREIWVQDVKTGKYL